MDKKGFIDSIYLTLIIVFALAVLIFFIYVGALIMPIVTQSSNDITGQINLGVQTSGDSNLINATEVSVGNANAGIQSLKYVGLFMIVVSLIGFIIMCAFVRTYPFLLFIWLIAMTIMIFITLIFSYSYTEMKGSGDYLNSAYSSWSDTDFVLSYLPHIITAIMIVGAIVMYYFSATGGDQYYPNETL